MTAAEFISKTNKKIDQLTRVNEAVFLAAGSAHAEMIKRIFTDGNASDGNRIGQYSTKDIWINPKNSPRVFPTQGKTGKKTHGENEPYKTRYFKGYKEYKQTIGRESQFVNLGLFYDLKNDFSNSLRRGAGDTWESEIKRIVNIKKAEGNQKRFGKVIFAPTNSEKELYTNALNFEINRILNA